MKVFTNEFCSTCRCFMFLCLTSLSSLALAQEPLSASYQKSSYIGNYNIRCFGGHDGFIDLTVTGGVGGYTYLWNNNETSQDLANLVAGTYSVTITDSNSNSLMVENIRLHEPPVLSLNLSSTQISCYGMTNGKISAEVSGGSPSYAYLWSTASTQSSISGLSSGNYSVTVTDGNECVISGSTAIIEPAQLSISLVSPINGNGFNVNQGQRDGNINLTVTGGTPSFTYQWSNGAFSENINNLDAGMYGVRVTDSKACFLIDSINLTSEDSLPLGSVPITTRGNWINPLEDFIGSRNAAALNFKTSNLERMRIDQDGNLGIGINNPSAKIDVLGTARLRGALTLDNYSFIPGVSQSNQMKKLLGVNSAGEIVLTDIALDLNVIDPQTPVSPCNYLNLHWGTLSQGDANIHNCPIDGNVGIGEVNPLARLHLSGSSDQSLLITTGNASTKISSVTSNGYAETQIHYNNKFSIWSSSGSSLVNRITIDPSGAIGIGTMVPSSLYKLDVVGTIRACELFINNPGWCDYVFDIDYKLRSIDDLSKFIKQNNHLPDVASSVTIEKDGGINMMEMQKAMMVKIEELHLYIISLNTEINNLKRMNETRNGDAFKLNNSFSK